METEARGGVCDRTTRRVGPIKARLKQLVRAETGSILILAVAAFAAITAFVGLSVDVGTYLHERSSLQNAVDAAVLAAAQQLPGSPSQAIADGTTWFGKNGGAAGEMDSISVTTTGSSSDTVTVTAHRSVPFFLAPFFGKDSATTDVSASARIYGLLGQDHLMPWGLLTTNPCFSGGKPKFGVSCTLKYGSSDGTSPGDYGALRLYGGSGASIYRTAVNNGSTDIFRIGQQVSPESGNMVGPTNQGLGDRLRREPTPGCGDGAGQDTFSEVFTLDAAGYYHINCPDSPRIMVIPVVDRIAYPATSTILDFVLMYLENSPGGGQVVARAVSVNYQASSHNVIGAYTGNGIRFIRLTQ